MLASILLVGWLIDSGHFKAPLARFISARAQRAVAFEGGLSAQVLTLHPRLSAENVIIGNPPWMPAGQMAKIGKISLVLRMPWFGRPLCIEKLTVEGASLILQREVDGRANWQWREPSVARGGSLEIIHSLSMPDAHIDLDDQRRHLKFSGVVGVSEIATADKPKLRISGSGDLNGRGDVFQIDGDPLSTSDHGSPYHFEYSSQSGGSQLSGRGLLPRPFDLDFLSTEFHAAGPNLKDLYFLAGVSLVNTADYDLAGRLERRGTNTNFSDLLLTSGTSDLRGEVSVDSSGARPRFEANVSSQRLRLKDLGTRAAHQAAQSSAPTLLFSDTPFNPQSARRSDGVVNYHAQRVEVGRAPLQGLSAKLTLDHGKLAVASLSAVLFGGKLAARGHLDASRDNPLADFDIKITDLQLGQYLNKGDGPPAMDGLMQLRAIATGHGRSLHQVAASADGTLSAGLVNGVMRTSLAELTGIDLRGLGMKLAKNMSQTPVPCAAANFHASRGILTSQSLIIDSEPVMIIGGGEVHLDSESLDLQLRGHPKAMRLRVPLPIDVRGTLLHPSFGVGAAKSASGSAKSEEGSGAVDCAAALASARGIEKGRPNQAAAAL